MAHFREVAPTSERIIADIEDFPNVLQKIVDEDGCMVSECKLRHGHRLLAHKGDGRVLKRKVTQRQRKHLLTFGDFHPDAIDAVNLIFACADPLISLEALINNNAAQNAVEAAAPPPLTDAEIAEANEVFEEELDELGEGENDPDGEDDPEGEDEHENLEI